MMCAENTIRVDVGMVHFGPIPPVRHELVFTDDVDLQFEDEPVHIRRGTVMSVEKSTGDTVDVSVPVLDSVVRFNIPHSELFERFHPVTESA